VRKPTGLRVDVDAGTCPQATASLLERAVRRTLEAERRTEAEVSLALLADPEMRELNRRYLGKDLPTDVLAFSLGDGDEVIGDVYVGVDQAARQATDLGITLEEELVRLAVHGTLHVLGHDHPEGPEREQCAMFRVQEQLVAGLRSESAT
jgi:probable rRNA maturation factor